MEPGCIKEGLLVVIIILLNKTIYNSYGLFGVKNIKN